MEIISAFCIRLGHALAGNIFVALLLVAVGTDMVFGSMRAFKYHCWNSSIGIDGAIRKSGMIASVLLFTIVDMFLHVDLLNWLPADVQDALAACGVVKAGMTELFATLYILYEATSVLKNMLLCGLPVPAGLRTKLAEFLKKMTDETNADLSGEAGTEVYEGTLGLSREELKSIGLNNLRALADEMSLNYSEDATADDLADAILSVPVYVEK